jgi:hypothetical protein
VDAAEAALATGPALFALSAAGATADAAGNLQFTLTYALNPSDPGQAAILQHFGDQALNVTGLALGPDGADYNPYLPVAQGQTVALTDASAASALASVSDQAFLSQASALLAKLAPYELNPEGTAPVAAEPAGAATPSPTGTYAALLVPSNGSGALGEAVVTFDRAGTSVTVDLVMTGLEPGQEHASHIHGFANDVPSLLPNYRLDEDGDGFVEDGEGDAVVGPVILGLTRDGSISDAVLTADFPVADAAGNLHLRQTYDFNTADPVQLSLFTELEQRLTGREVQVHGLTVPATEGEGTNFEVNGVAGYKPNLPVANGILLPVVDAATAQALAALGPSLDAALAGGAGSADLEAIGARLLAEYLGTGHAIL